MQLSHPFKTPKHRTTAMLLLLGVCFLAVYNTHAQVHLGIPTRVPQHLTLASTPATAVNALHFPFLHSKRHTPGLLLRAFLACSSLQLVPLLVGRLERSQGS